MTSGHSTRPGASATGTGPERSRQAARREELARRTEEILRTPSGEADPEQRTAEQETVRVCRRLTGLLSRRRRSAGELRERLTAWDVPPAIAHEAMARLDRAGLLDDGAFAQEWVRQRRGLRGLSDEALRRELRAKGVADAHAATALALGDDDEEERARRLVRGRLAREEQHLLAEDDRAARARVARRLDALLRRKGYDGALALRVISTELRALTGR